MLLGSDTDMIAVHALPIYDADVDGLVATDKGAAGQPEPTRTGTASAMNATSAHSAGAEPRI